MNTIQRLELLAPANALSVPGLVAVWDGSDPRNGGVGLADGDGITILENLADPRRAFFDQFTRANSTTALGNGWTAGSGDTFGILSNKAYSVTSAHDDLAYRESGLADGVMSCVVSGRFDASYSIPCLIFRMTDTNNYLMVNLDATTVYLYKKATTFTLLASGASVSVNDTDYTLDVIYTGNAITIKKNGTTVISHTLTGGNTAYAAYTQVGIRLSTSGTPASVAKWDNFFVCKLTDAFQTTAATKLVYETGIRNGRAVARASGSQYMLTAANNLLRNAPGATVYIVLQTTAPGTQANSLLIGNNAGAARLTMLRERTGAGVLEVGGRRLDADAYAAINGGSFTAGAWSIDVGVLDYAQSDAYLYKNGGLITSSTSFQTDGNTSDTDSAGTSIGATPTGTTPINGDIAEIRLYNVTHTAAHQRRVLRDLSRKWGLPLTA